MVLVSRLLYEYVFRNLNLVGQLREHWSWHTTSRLLEENVNFKQHIQKVITWSKDLNRLHGNRCRTASRRQRLTTCSWYRKDKLWIVRSDSFQFKVWIDLIKTKTKKKKNWVLDVWKGCLRERLEPWISTLTYQAIVFPKTFKLWQQTVFLVRTPRGHQEWIAFDQALYLLLHEQDTRRDPNM